MCCGQKRAELRGSANLKTTPNLPQSTPGNVAARTAFMPASGKANAPQKTPQSATLSTVAGLHSTINLRYSEASPIQVRGPITGRVYSFSRLHLVQAVDPRDAAALLSTRFFRRA